MFNANGQKTNDRYSCYGNMYRNSERKDSQHTDSLPPGIRELKASFFTVDTACRFDRETALPLLNKTNLIFLKRFKSNALTSKRNSRSGDLGLKFPGVNMRNRSSSLDIGTDFYDCRDMRVLRACWEVILSFMEDESVIEEKDQNYGFTTAASTTTTPKLQQLPAAKKIWNKLNGNTGVVKRQKSYNKRPQSMVLLTDFKENKKGEKLHFQGGSSALSKEVLKSMTVLEKVHYITTVGLQTPVFRDEIYCLILKQLVGNPSVRSSALGWILFSVVMGCFPPSPSIQAHVEVYLRELRTACSNYCLGKLKRTLENGGRMNPPCSLELQAAKTRQSIRVPVICMDHSVRTITADPSTTADEVCASMAAKNQFDDGFGFSLYLALDNKLVSLGNRSFHLMDAISQAETFSRLNNVKEHWRIYYRREYFSPRDSVCLDRNQSKMRLTYFQICGGVQSGEYQCSKSQDLCLMMAHQYLVKYGPKFVSFDKVQSLCDRILPSSALIEGKKRDWCQMVYETLKALTAKSKSNSELNDHNIMKEVIFYASKAFLENFTKIFHLSKFREVSNTGLNVGFALMTLNHVTVVVTSATTQSPKKNANPILNVEVCDVKSVDPQCENDEKFLLKLRNGKGYELETSQRAEVIGILKRYSDESVS